MKVGGRTGNLGEAITIARASGNNSLVITSSGATPLSKRYLKYLTKKVERCILLYFVRSNRLMSCYFIVLEEAPAP